MNQYDLTMEETSIKNRVVWIDWFKAILIILVVMGHTKLNGYERTWIYGFHMPAFFVISGYLYKQRNWWKTLKGIAIPIGTFSLIRLLIYIVSNRTYIMDRTISELVERITLPFLKCNVENEITLFSGIRFIVCYVFCRFMSGDLLKVKFGTLYLMAIACALWMCIVPFVLSTHSEIKDWFLYRIIACLPFFVIGIAWKNYAVKLQLKAMGE